MPSIPQSLLWISLVVLWLFVLVPMLISKRDAVRRTSDVALATRVLNGATSVPAAQARGPASGHRSDPDWRPSEDDLDEDFDERRRRHDTRTTCKRRRRSVVVAAPSSKSTEPDYLDVDVIEEPSGALPVGAVDAGARSTTARRRVKETDELTLNFEEPAEENVDTAVLRGRDRRVRRRRAATAPTTSTSTSRTPRAWRRPRRAICRSRTR